MFCGVGLSALLGGPYVGSHIAGLPELSIPWLSELPVLGPDSVVAARAGQKTPDGYYNIERMLKRVLASKGAVLLCGTCMDARGISENELMGGARRSTMDELASATVEADKVLVF